MRNLVCGIDLGTTSIKAALIDSGGSTFEFSSRPVPATGMTSGEGEFDADRYFEAVCSTVRTAVDRCRGGAGNGEKFSIDALGIASQRATIVPVGKDGLACGPALSWQDTRCCAAAERLLASRQPGWFTRITGLPPGALWSIGKIAWLREKNSRLFRKTRKFVLLHDYVLSRLGADEFCTDFSNASLTGLLDVRKLCWSPVILEVLEIDSSMLPTLKPAAAKAGTLSREAAGTTGLDEGTTLVVGGGDQQCSALGLGIVDPGTAALGLGTAMIVGCPVDRPVTSPRNSFMCTCHVVPGRWVLEGIHNSFGSSLQWTRKLLGIKNTMEFELLATTAPAGSGGVVFLPFLAGAGTPDYDAGARGSFTGLNLSSDGACIARAAIEGVCLEVRRILAAAGRSVRIRELVISGGGSKGSFLQQVLADMTGCCLGVSSQAESTVAGAAMVAATGIGMFESLFKASEAMTGQEPGTRVLPVLEKRRREDLFRRYVEAVAEHGPSRGGQGRAT